MDYVGTILFFIENSKLYFLIPYDSNHKLHLPTKLKPVDEPEVSCAFASIPSSQTPRMYPEPPIHMPHPAFASMQ